MSDGLAINQHVLRALEYLRILEIAQISISDSELDCFAQTSLPQSVQIGSQMSLMAKSFIGEPVVLRKADAVSQYLRRVGWIAGPESACHVSALGRAIVNFQSTESSEDETVQITVISPESEFSYAHAHRIFSDPANDLLLDPHFRVEQISWLSDSGRARRVLTASDAAKTLETLFANGSEGITFEVRHLPKDELHDRVLLRDNGHVLMLGQGLNRFGKTLTGIVDVAPPCSNQFAAEIERLWKKAEPIVGRRIGA